ncbi:MAG TPA: hypothetical protein ENI77_13245 [Nitrospirae bacterium]|nr:hypothetical protein [Nitrospirota bacterium]
MFILFSALVFAIPATAYDEGSSGSTTTINSFFTVTVRKEGAPPAGFGYIWSVPNAISCPGTCSAEFNSGTVVELFVKSTHEMDFSSWGGDCDGTDRSHWCTLTMDSDKDVPVRFYPRARWLKAVYVPDDNFGDAPLSAKSVKGDILIHRLSCDANKRDDGASERASCMDATVVLTNTSTRSVDIGLIAGADPLDAPFEIFDDTCSDTTLPHYQECSFNIIYTDPDSTVLSEDTFDIPSSDPDFPTWTVTVREAEEDDSGN